MPVPHVIHKVIFIKTLGLAVGIISSNKPTTYMFQQYLLCHSNVLHQVALLVSDLIPAPSSYLILTSIIIFVSMDPAT